MTPKFLWNNLIVTIFVPGAYYPLASHIPCPVHGSDTELRGNNKIRKTLSQEMIEDPGSVGLK